MPDISIIVPVYNVEKYIQYCIDSILHQSFEDFELILVDDGSTDLSGKMCDEYARKDGRIRVIHQDWAGLSSARNAGLSVAAGHYIAFVDSDDYIHKDMLLKLYNCIRKYEADIVLCGVEGVDASGRFIDERPVVKRDGVLDKTNTLKMLDRIPFVVVTNKLFKRELFSGVQFPVGKINEDAFVMHRLMYRAETIAAVSESLYYYRKRAESIMNSRLTIKRLDYIEALYNRVLFYEKNGLSELSDETTCQCIDKFIWLRKYLIISSNEEKERLRQVKQMVRYCYIKHGRYLNKWNILNIEAPRLYDNLLSFKRKLFPRK